jgi:hypothetical protein
LPISSLSSSIALNNSGKPSTENLLSTAIFKIFLFESVFPVQKLPRSQQSLPIERQTKIIADESNPVYRHRESKSRVC